VCVFWDGVDDVLYATLSCFRAKRRGTGRYGGAGCAQTKRGISQKGGVGKTTLAIHLAVAFAADGLNVAILDLDPQASAAEWKDFREEEMPGVIAIPSSRLPKVLQELEGRGADVVILDTAPHSEGTALDAARAADLILVPCQPSIMDLRACGRRPIF
jgi:chromosome partitioning protein